MRWTKEEEELYIVGEGEVEKFKMHNMKFFLKILVILHYLLFLTLETYLRVEK
jgi:hypothetical protein